MQHMRIKLLIGGIALAVAVGYLLFAGLKDGWVYHVEVGKFIQNPELRTQRVRLVGQVREGGLEASPAKMVARFDLGDDLASLPVVYRGAIPDLFKAGSDVIVEGRMDAAGVFQADILMTKCASKYQVKDHAARTGETS
jgi:cytochrome c-type biogenesis protein CcmE